MRGGIHLTLTAATVRVEETESEVNPAFIRLSLTIPIIRVRSEVVSMARRVWMMVDFALTALFLLVSLVLFWPVAGYRRRHLSD